MKAHDLEAFNGIRKNVFWPKTDYSPTLAREGRKVNDYNHSVKSLPKLTWIPVETVRRKL